MRAKREPNRIMLLGLLLCATDWLHAATDACDSSRGQQVFATKCATCHPVLKEAPSSAGPNLHGVIGRAPASRGDFVYSPAMQALKLPWTIAALNDYMEDPQARLPGTYMAFTGVKRAADRAAILCYLQALRS